MSEAHPDADLVKVTRTTTTYEPAAKTSEAGSVKQRRNHVLLWVVGACLIVAIAVAGVIYMNNQDTAGVAQQGAAADQGVAQTLAQKAATAQQTAQAAQQSANQSQAQARSLADNAAQDSIAARRAAVRANAAGKDAGSTTN